MDYWMDQLGKVLWDRGVRVSPVLVKVSHKQNDTKQK